jgi:hypothetical protein
MNDNKIIKQFHAMFGIFMVFFYLGVGIFLLFFGKMFKIDSALRGILGITFLLYGVYRIYLTYKQIKDAFFQQNNDTE